MIPSTDLQRVVLAAHTDDLHRRAATRAARRGRRPAVRTAGGELTDRRITIRAGRPDDVPALVRVAELDSAELPQEPLLVAEIDGVLRAAVSRRSGAVIADPFQPTAAAVELLRLRSAQLGSSSRSRRRRPFSRLVARLAATSHDAAEEAT
jgi:hypothetical protein